ARHPAAFARERGELAQRKYRSRNRLFANGSFETPSMKRVDAGSRSGRMSASDILTGHPFNAASGLYLVRSKVELQSELNHARISGRCDRTKGRVAEHAVRVGERRRVRQIEDLRAELEISDFVNVRPLDEGDVRRAIAGAAHRVARGVPERELRRDRKGRRVEPAAGRALIRGQGRVVKNVW